jgi:hypothetical protein
VAGAPQAEDADPPLPPVPEGGGVVAVEPLRPGPVVALVLVAAVVSVVAVEPVPPPLVAVVEPLCEPGPDPEPAVVDDIAPLPEDVVVALAGVPFAPDGDGGAARAGEIATSPTTPAASGNRNRRCMAASSIDSCIFANSRTD